MTMLLFDCRHRFDSGFELSVAFEATHPVTALFGPSGSGKTSILSMIAGFLPPRSGRISLGGRTLLDTAAHISISCPRRHVGFVFQDHLLFPHLTVEGNLRYGARRRRDRPSRIELSRVRDVLELGPLLGRYPESLSGGERQRVTIGRALLSNPDLLLMDEPLASLDDALKSRIMAYLERVIGEWSIPTIFVSHGQGAVRRLAGSVIVIENGRVVARGAPDDALGQGPSLGWKDALAPVNLLRLDRVRPEGAHHLGTVGAQEVHLPPAAASVSGPLFVQFSPDEVILSRRDVTGLSTRNHLRGRVRQIVDLPGGVFVAIDVGQVIWSKVTPEAAAELELCAGAEVVCLIKTHALRVIGGSG